MKVKKRVPLGSLHKKWIDIIWFTHCSKVLATTKLWGMSDVLLKMGISYWKWMKMGDVPSSNHQFSLQMLPFSCCKIEVLTRSIPQVVHLSVDSQVYVPPKIVSGMSWICCKNWGIQFRVLSILALLATPHPENELGESDLKTSLWQTSPTEAGFRSTKNQCE